MTIRKIKVKVKKLHPDAKVPVLGTEYSAGFDIHSVEEKTLQPGERHAFGTGISIEVPDGYVTLFWDRSGMGFKGIHRFAGVIDSDYRGELKIILFNSTKEPFTIEKGDRIVQAIIQEYFTPDFELSEDLEDSQRGAGGFGSTGMK
ncbi:MAG: dUTP diphosphatase [archaeon]